MGASEAAWFVTDEAIQILGGNGYMRALGLEKVMRDLRIFRIFEGTNDILRLMIALQSIQVLGKMITANKMMAVKANVGEKLGMTLVGNASGKLGALADGALSSEAKSVEEAINRFHASSVNLVVKHQKKIIQQQFALKRVADCMIDLYTASACISRATAAVQQQKENADLEVQLAKIYITEALARVNESIRQIEGDSEHHKRMATVGKQVAEANGVIHSHPLGF